MPWGVIDQRLGGSATMDAVLQVNRLVTGLLSEQGAECAQALAQVDPSSLSKLQFQAIREALRHARSQGRLSDAAYEDVSIQMDRWYRAGDGSNTDDLLPPVLIDRDPTIDMVSSTVRPLEPNAGVASPEAKERADLLPAQVASLPAQLSVVNAAVERTSEPDRSISRETPLASEGPVRDAAVAASRAQFVPGATIRERFVLEEQIGNGGSAIVFRARDLRRDPMDRDAYVALKVAREERRDREDMTQRLKREFHQSQELSHPGIVRPIDIDCEHGTWFLTMELLDGESLSALLASRKAERLPQRDALAIISGCGEALAYAHEHGVLHCDFKPGNVFVTRSKQVRVLDFGVVTRATLTGDVGPFTPGPRVAAATPRYASPEVLGGEPPNERDDVFSLACVSYEVLTGRHPFGGLATVNARDRGLRVARVPGLSESRFAAIEHGLQWSNRKRPANVRDFLAELGISPRRRRYGLGLILGLTAAALGTFVVATILFRADRDALQPSYQHEPAPLPALSASETPVTAPSSPQTRSAAVPANVEPSAVAGARPSGTLTQPAHDSRTAAGEPRNAASAASAMSAKRGRISLEQPNVMVDERAVLAVVRVKRLDDLRGPARVQWRAIPGSAKPGSDYGVDGLHTLDIPEGHDVRVIYVPIQHDTIREGDESFEIELLAPAGRTRLGPVTRATVTILDED